MCDDAHASQLLYLVLKHRVEAGYEELILHAACRSDREGGTGDVDGHSRLRPSSVAPTVCALHYTLVHTLQQS